VKTIFGYRLFWLAIALSLWQLGCGTNSNSTLDAAKAQRTLTLWLEQHPTDTISAITITGPVTPFQGDQNHIVVRCHVQRPALDAPESRAHFVHGQDGNWYLATIEVILTGASGPYALFSNINLKVQ
jgi:hypothetical protein